MVKTKRGAPKKNGVLDGIVLIRRLETVAAYQKARVDGKTDRVAKELAIESVMQRFPNMKISKSEVERALKELQPNEEMKAGRDVFVPTLSAFGIGGVVKYSLVKYKSLRKPNYLFNLSKKIKNT